MEISVVIAARLLGVSSDAVLKLVKTGRLETTGRNALGSPLLDCDSVLEYRRRLKLRNRSPKGRVK